MTSAVSIKLPWPPSINGAWYRGVKGRLTKKGRAFRDQVIELTRQRNSEEALIDAPIRLDLYFFPPDRRIRDNSNHTKVLYDALTKSGFWADDSLVKSETYHTGEVVAKGCLILYCEPINFEPWKYDDVALAHGITGE